PSEGWWMRFYPNWLRCRPTGNVLNLARKELRLHRSLVRVAAIFCTCWLSTLAFLCLQPARQALCEVIFNVLTAFYVPLMAVLAGCVSLGEEKAIGLTDWHLTLPVSARRQWLTKVIVAAGVGVILGLTLPLALAACTAPLMKVGLIYFIRD